MAILCPGGTIKDQGAFMKYQTRDQWLAAYLLFLKNKREIRFEETIKADDGSVVFLFSPYDDCEKAIKKYFNLEDEPAHAKEYFDAYKEVKTMISAVKFQRYGA